jgi:WD40 repeat protein
MAKSLATGLVMGVPAWIVAAGMMHDEPGLLSLHTAEPGVTVTVDDQAYDAARGVVGPLEVIAGEHRVRVSRDGVVLFDDKVSVEPGEQKDVWANWANASAPADPAADLGGERTRMGHDLRVSAVGFAGRGTLGFTADESGTLRFWDVTGGQAERLIDAHRGAIEAIAVADDGSLMLSVADDGVLRVWDVARGREVRALRLSGTERAVALAVTRDGRLAAVGDQHAQVVVVELATGRELCRAATERCSTGSLAFTPDGASLVVGLVGGGGAAHPIEVREATTGRLVKRLAGHTGPVWGLACLPDGRRLVSAGGDRVLRVWDLTTGRQLSKLGNHPGAARCLALSPDGRLAVVGTGNRWSAGWRKADAYGVQVWDLSTGACLGRFATDSAVCSVALSPDGRRAVAAGEDHVVRTWDMPTPAAEAKAASAPVAVKAASPTRVGST